MQLIKADVLKEIEAELGEGAIWESGNEKLYWVDIEQKLVHIYDPILDINKDFFVGHRVSTVVPTQNSNVLIAMENGIHKLDSKTGELNFITNPLQKDNVRFNDGKCDPAGRFWVGSMELNGREGAGTLYRMDKDQCIYTMIENVSVSNGIVWTSDKKTMYYIDTPTLAVQKFDYDHETGAISNGRVIIDIPSEMGIPDGMTIDSNNNLWIALWGGSAVVNYNPLTGKLLKKIKLPVPHITSCTFGGKNLETLYITTARQGLSEEQLEKYPLSGSLFYVKPGEMGVPGAFYRGNLS